MAPGLSRAAADELLALAWASIEKGVAGGGPFVPDLRDASPAVRRPGAAFVTVMVAGDLNGCIGTLEADEPLGAAVARLAWDAAFADPRLPPLTAADLPAATVKVSVLGPLEPLACTSEDELCGALRPGVDGLLLVADGHRATFLPGVWHSLPDPVDFVRQLEAKAGLPPGYWSPSASCFRYQVAEVTSPG